jgi:hypothetical protein
VQRAKGRAVPREIGDRAAHRRRHVGKFQISEDLLPAPTQLREQLEVLSAHAEFETELVKRDRVPEPIDPRQRLLFRRNIERENKAVARIEGAR